MARPPKREFKDYEKLAINEFIPGEIEDIEYDDEHKFSFQGTDSIQPGIRFKFRFDGYKYSHYSRWMKFNMGKKANLYLKYVAKLVKDAKPDMDFDLDELIGMRIRAVWSENKDFQNLDLIAPEKAMASVVVIDEKEVNEALDGSEEHEEQLVDVDPKDPMGPVKAW